MNDAKLRNSCGKKAGHVSHVTVSHMAPGPCGLEPIEKIHPDNFVHFLDCCSHALRKMNFIEIYNKLFGP